jgi:phenylalanine-4-hydroxylase
VWRDVYFHLTSLYPAFACKEYNDCFRGFELWDQRIPQFHTINAKLFNHCFSLAPVAGLVIPHQFLVKLAENTMLCTQYIRHHSVPGYTPEPDVIHEIFGHAVFFLNEDIRKISRLFGQVAQHANDEEITGLIRLYWYTLEFGLCKEGNKIKAFGAGLLSSIGELSTICNVPIREFDIEEMVMTEFDTMNPQPFLFCAESFEVMVKELTCYLNYRKIKGKL